MCCGKSQNVVIEELSSILKFVENENSHLEKERNELKSLYHNRPQEERNIAKDILIMHTDLDSSVGKLKEIVDELAMLPTEQSVNTYRGEEIASQIVVMQTSLKRKHDIMEKLLLQKIDYQRLKEQSGQQLKSLASDTEYEKYKAIELAGYSDFKTFSKKFKELNDEIERLKELVLIAEGKKTIDITFSQLVDINVIGLNKSEALAKLRQTQGEIRKLEQEIGRAHMTINLTPPLNDKSLVEKKKIKVNELRNTLESINREARRSKFFPREDDCNKRINILDNIINKKPHYLEMPRPSTMASIRQNTLLQDIEDTLRRVRSIPAAPKRIYDSK